MDIKHFVKFWIALTSLVLGGKLNWFTQTEW